MDTVVRDRLTAVTIGGLVLILIVVGIVLALREPPTAVPGTPEATAQGFYRAVLDRDLFGAEAHLADAVVDQCDGVFHLDGQIGDGLRIVIVDSDVRGARAIVTMSITETYDEGPFFSGSHSFDEVLTMDRVGDRWLISATPWPLYCREV